MKLLYEKFVQFEQTLQPQIDGEPIWLSSEPRPKFEWEEIYQKDKKILTFKREDGVDSFNSFSDQLIILLDHIINIDPEKFSIFISLKENIQENFISQKDDVSQLNIEAVSHIKSTLEKHILLLKYRNEQVSKSDFELFTVIYCFSGASSNISNMMQLFYPSKIMSLIYSGFKKYLEQEAIDYCRDNSLIDSYNSGNESHYVNGLMNFVLESKRMAVILDGLIPNELLENYKDNFLKKFEKEFTSEIIFENILNSFSVPEKEFWNNEEIESFFSVFENINKDPSDPDVNYWEIMFEFDDENNVYIPKKDINILYKLYFLNLAYKENFIDYLCFNLKYEKNNIQLCKYFIDGKYYIRNEPKITQSGVLQSTTFSELKSFENSGEIILANFNIFKMTTDFNLLFKNSNEHCHLRIAQSLINSNNNLTYDFHLIKSIYENLSESDFATIIKTNFFTVVLAFVFTAISDNTQNILDCLYDISKKDERINSYIENHISICIINKNINSLIFIAKAGRWKVCDNVMFELCKEQLQLKNYDILFDVIRLPEVNRIKITQIKIIIEELIESSNFDIVEKVLEEKHVFENHTDYLIHLLESLYNFFIIDIESRSKVFELLIRLVVINNKDVNWSNYRAKIISKIFANGFIDEGKKLCLVANDYISPEQILFYFIKLNSNDSIITKSYPESDKAMNKNYDFQLNIHKYNLATNMVLGYLMMQKEKTKVSDNGEWCAKQSSPESTQSFYCNYYLALRLLLDFSQPNNMSFLLDFKLKTAKSLIDKFIGPKDFEIDPELQSMIDKIKSWKVKKFFNRR